VAPAELGQGSPSRVGAGTFTFGFLSYNCIARKYRHFHRNRKSWLAQNVVQKPQLIYDLLSHWIFCEFILFSLDAIISSHFAKFIEGFSFRDRIIRSKNDVVEPSSIPNHSSVTPAPASPPMPCPAKNYCPKSSPRLPNLNRTCDKHWSLKSSQFFVQNLTLSSKAPMPWKGKERTIPSVIKIIQSRNWCNRHTKFQEEQTFLSVLPPER